MHAGNDSNGQERNNYSHEEIPWNFGPTRFAELCSFAEVNRPHVLSAHCRSRRDSACAEETSRVSHKLYRNKSGCTWNNCGDVEKLLCCEESSFLLSFLITIIQTNSPIQTCSHFDKRMLLTRSRLNIFFTETRIPIE